MQAHILVSFEAIRPYISDPASLVPIRASEAAQLRVRFPALPDEYLHFLTHFGHGNLGALALYPSPVAPTFVYSEVRATSLEGIVLFADDMQGYCFGFDLSDDGRVVEVDPRGLVDRTIEPSFTAFLHSYLLAAS